MEYPSRGGNVTMTFNLCDQIMMVRMVVIYFCSPENICFLDWYGILLVLRGFQIVEHYFPRFSLDAEVNSTALVKLHIGFINNRTCAENIWHIHRQFVYAGYLRWMRILRFKRIIWSVDILLPDHFVLFQHFSMEKALAFHSIAIIYNRNTTFYFESIVALLQSHFCQVRISLVNTYALEDILTQLHTFNSTHLQKKKSFFLLQVWCQTFDTKQMRLLQMILAFLKVI